jgi:ABC-type arginine transport system permease subunit
MLVGSWALLLKRILDMSNGILTGVVVPVMLFIFYGSCFVVHSWAVKSRRRDRMLISAFAYGTVVIGVFSYLYWQGVDI